MIRPIKRHLRRFLRREDGQIAVEFVLGVPLLFTLFMTSVDLGLHGMNRMWLERGVDMTVRMVRLNTGANYTHDDLKDMICDYSGDLADCQQTLRLEMKTIDPRAFTGFSEFADCVDVSQPVTPLREFVHGGSHQLMLMRACYGYKPAFPTAGFGGAMEKDGSGRLQITAQTVFVQEPGA